MACGGNAAVSYLGLRFTHCIAGNLLYFAKEFALKVLNEKIGKIVPEFKSQVKSVNVQTVEQYNDFIS